MSAAVVIGMRSGVSGAGTRAGVRVGFSVLCWSGITNIHPHSTAGRYGRRPGLRVGRCDRHRCRSSNHQYGASGTGSGFVLGRYDRHHDSGSNRRFCVRGRRPGIPAARYGRRYDLLSNCHHCVHGRGPGFPVGWRQRRYVRSSDCQQRVRDGSSHLFHWNGSEQPVVVAPVCLLVVLGDERSWKGPCCRRWS